MSRTGYSLVKGHNITFAILVAGASIIKSSVQFLSPS